MFKKWREHKQFKKERELWQSIPDEWYFDVEYHIDDSCYTQHMKFPSLKSAEYWCSTNQGIYVLAVTDRQGNRIITDWTGYTGAGSISLWNNMDRSVLYLRDGHNDLWLPRTNKRAKNAKEKKCIY